MFYVLEKGRRSAGVGTEVMYTSQFFEVTDVERAAQFIDAHEFGALVSQTKSGLMATHVPMLRVDGALLGHMARLNPQHASTEEGDDVMVIFSGLDSYISPDAYRDEPDVPTWNYQVAHVHGRWKVVRDHEAVFAHLDAMVAKQEGDSPTAWRSGQLDAALYAGLYRGIVAFRVEITRIECAFKLSQDKTEIDRRGVIDWLDATGRAERQELAQIMRKFYGY